MLTLLAPYELSSQLTLKNRIVMAPMTRNMADELLVPTQLMAEYYARRASVGLIVTEGTIIRPDGKGYTNTPGIFTTAQIEGWRRVTKRVHEQGGKIFSQIWHVGRVSHPYFLEGALPVSASQTMMSGQVRRAPEELHYGECRALSQKEIQQLVIDFARAAENAMHAGFDGIEIHAANGYLIDQFLHQDTNLRGDPYGRTAECRARFALEIVQACGEAVGFGRVGIRLSPAAYLNEIKPKQSDQETFKYLLSELNQKNIAYVHTGSFDDMQKHQVLGDLTMSDFLSWHYDGTIIACGGYTVEAAEELLHQKKNTLVAFGRPILANPDFVEKVEREQALQPYDESMLAKLN